MRWLLEKDLPDMEQEIGTHSPSCGDLTELNQERLILDSVGKETLRNMAEGILDLLDTSLIIFEANGDYALSLYVSDWCRLLDLSSRRLCASCDNQEALQSGQWLCHANAWDDSAKAAIGSGQPTDIECVGGIRLYAVPIRAGDRIVGAVSLGYGTPPKDPEILDQLSQRFKIEVNLVKAAAERYRPRPPFIIDVARKNLRAMATLIGEIIERKQVEEQHQQLQEQLVQAQKMEAIGRLTAGVAHDFNNLLTVINGYADRILEQISPEHPFHIPVERISDAGWRAAKLIQQLMIFSRKEIRELQVLDLNEVISHVEKMLRRLIGENIQMDSMLDPNLWKIKADLTQIEQVVVNLAVNARDAMPDGGTLRIETSNIVVEERPLSETDLPEPNEYVLLTVSDTGAGMSEETQAHIFEPYFTTKDMGKGTGLGLATVYGIVSQSGGHITVESRLGQGSSFRVYLPRVEVDEPASITPAQPEEPVHHPGNKTILLIEDDADVRELVGNLLRNHGYQLLEATDGTQAQSAALSHPDPIHLLITDVVLPDENGAQIARTIKRSTPDLKILFVSGYTQETISRHGVLERGVHFLRKPFSSKQLAEKVHELLDESQ
jgi:signal transduction histidine kinase/ActR/RegA family two-component response regulator